MGLGTEHIMQYIWQWRLYGSPDKALTDGTPLRIVYPGRLNTASGPDFSDARLTIGSVAWAGNVELHVRGTATAITGTGPMTPSYFMWWANRIPLSLVRTAHISRSCSSLSPPRRHSVSAYSAKEASPCVALHGYAMCRSRTAATGCNVWAWNDSKPKESGSWIT